MNYQNALRECLARKDLPAAEQAARAAFADPQVSEEVLEWVSGMVYEAGLQNAFELISAFIDRFPHSLGLARIYWADLCLSNTQADEALLHVQQYLRLARDAGMLEKLGSAPIIRHGVTRAFLYLAAIYASVGARSYALRVIAAGQRYPIQEDLRPFYAEDGDKLRQELALPNNQAADARWETFFKSGAAASDLINVALGKGMHYLAKRLEIITGNFRCNSSYQLTDEEIFQLVMQDDNGASTLV